MASSRLNCSIKKAYCYYGALSKKFFKYLYHISATLAKKASPIEAFP